ncbi:hypothetical protein Ae201684P_020163 [Aphanomyces euteiches]|nr:hypothetical protein Ae201684P_020163 [Aphanomyces euteiches]
MKLGLVVTLIVTVSAAHQSSVELNQPDALNSSTVSSLDQSSSEQVLGEEITPSSPTASPREPKSIIPLSNPFPESFSLLSSPARTSTTPLDNPAPYSLNPESYPTPPYTFPPSSPVSDSPQVDDSFASGAQIPSDGPPDSPQPTSSEQRDPLRNH